METPRTLRSSKHQPTPKMSDRKKQLFSCSLLTENDYSSLGPMTPLKYSSSPSSYSQSATKRTSFANILSSSEDEEDVTKRYSNSKKYEFLETNSNLVFHDEDTRLSFPRVLLTDCLTPTRNQKTPDTNKNQNQEISPRISFRKRFDKETEFTPTSSRRTPRSRTPRSLAVNKENVPEINHSKVRTSLQFSNTAAIPTKSFYSATATEQSAINPDLAKSDKPKISKYSNTQKGSKKSGNIRKSTPTIFHRKTNKSVSRNLKWYKDMRLHTGLPASIKNIKLSASDQKLIAHLQKSGSKSTSTSPEAKEAAERTRIIEQMQRVNTILKNSKNPIEMAKPLCLLNSSQESGNDSILDSTLNETTEIFNDVAPLDEVKTRKIFKSGANLNKTKYQLTDTLTATVKRGKLSLNKTKLRKRKFKSVFDEDDDVMSEEHQEVDNIIKSLDITTEVSASDVAPLSPTSQISNMTSELALNCPAPIEMDQEAPAQDKLFPLFYKGHSDKVTDLPQEPSNKRRKLLWRPIGANQYQLDAGQKEFGATQCPECQLVYTMHEPEEEILHNEFHKSFHIFKFKGWVNESIVTEVPEWGVSGRIICVVQSDGKTKWNRVKEILKMVDYDLGYAHTELHPRTMVYLAIDKNVVLGVCVVHPLAEANRILNVVGIDCCSVETYPVKCGVSRIWVSPPYRRQGVAAMLVRALKGHYIFGTCMSYDDIAFSAPTDAGKALAAKLTQRDDFLIYQLLN